MSPLLGRDAVIDLFTSPPERVISLVPSITESLFALGLGDSVVGITEYCIHPAESLVGIPRLSGPKNPDLNEIIALKPDLVIANQEENTPQALQKLAGEGLPVWISFPRSVQEAMDVLWTIVAIFQSRLAAMRLSTLQRGVDWAAASASDIPTWSYFCPIWQSDSGGNETGTPDWWMTFNQDTYMADLLRLFGGKNIFAERERRYPLEADLGKVPAEDPHERDTRYPRVTAEEIRRAAPDVILLPDEPYKYKATDLHSFQHCFPAAPATTHNRIFIIDGSLLTWHGTRLGKALNDLPGLLENL